MPEFLGSLLRRPPVGWWDLLDIAIVSLVIYEFLKLIRGTRAVQMAAGSLLIVALFYVSRLAPLQTVNWLIRNILVYVAFAAIVIFEREIGLRNYIESGIPLDATLTYDLLVTIFQPKSPLHDGAVILQESRVAAAACFLPLTVNPRLSRDLGTRHRAAIGLTEESDAAAVVVSEETGQISLALNGEIERPLSADALRDRLRRLVTVRRGRARTVYET